MHEDRPVLIAGAGIAGMALAIALAGRGVASRLLERRPVLSEAGAGIQLGPNAVHALRRLGVMERLAPMTGRPQAIAVHSGAGGRLLAKLPLGSQIEGRFGAPYVVAHRADLQAALLAGVEGAPLIGLARDAEVARWREAPGYVEAVLTDGRCIEGAALIGADGLWSTIRREMFGDHRLTYAGKVAARTVIPAAAAVAFSAPETGVWLGRDAHVVHYPVRGHQDIAVVAILNEPDRPDGEVGKSRGGENWGGRIEAATVLRRLAGFDLGLLGFMETAGEWRVWSLYDPPALPTWHRGRVALIGDAAHPILPFLAQGGAMAIEDAETLAALLARHRGAPQAAFAAYEAVRRPRVVRVQRASRENGRIYHHAGPMGVARDLVLSLVPGGSLMRRYDWLYGWNGDALPDPGA